MRIERFERYEGNPIITPEDIPYSGSARVFNPAAIKARDQIFLLMRIKTQRGSSHLTLAKSSDGLTNWQVSNSPTLEAGEIYGEHLLSGLEDPRIVWVRELNMFVITCVSASTRFTKNPSMVSIIGTQDFCDFERLGNLSPSEKNACLFPEKIRGKFVLIHRPSPDGQTCIAVSSSLDLKDWSSARPILSPMPKTWCNYRVGLGPQPIKTKKGWLIIFHGSEDIASKVVYYVGLALLDLKSLNVTHRSPEWVFGPREGYEGGMNGIVFPCGAVIKDGKLIMYYGAADSVIGAATANLDEVLDYLMKYPVKSPEK